MSYDYTVLFIGPGYKAFVRTATPNVSSIPSRNLPFVDGNAGFKGMMSRRNKQTTASRVATLTSPDVVSVLGRKSRPAFHASLDPAPVIAHRVGAP